MLGHDIGFSPAVHLVPRPYHPPVDRFVTLPPCLAFGIMVKGKAAGLLYDGAPIRCTVGLLSLDVPVIVDAPAREPQRPLGGSLGQLLWSPATRTRSTWTSRHLHICIGHSQWPDIFAMGGSMPSCISVSRSSGRGMCLVLALRVGTIGSSLLFGTLVIALDLRLSETPWVVSGNPDLRASLTSQTP